MNPSFLGAAAATLLVFLWLLGRRRPRPFLRSDDTTAVAALNRAQITRLAPAAGRDVPAAPSLSPTPPGRETVPVPGGMDGTAAHTSLPAPGDLRARRLLLDRLRAAAHGPLPERLEAVRVARRWRHPAALPLLRRALRDVHPAVVHEAALALEAYRGRTAPSAAALRRSSSPRRVVRTR